MRRSSEPACAIIESRLTNLGTTPIKVPQVMLADWNIDTQRLWEQVRFQPLAYRNDTWYGSTYWSGPDWTRIGKDWHHSGEQTASIRRFDVPRDGRLQVTGRVYKADPNGGDGVHVEIRLGREMSSGRPISMPPISRASSPHKRWTCTRVMQCDFVVHRRGTIGFDTTHWDPCLTFEDGEAFQASAAFSAQQQGAGQWFYEMETDASRQALLAWPTIHGLRPEFNLVHQNLASPEPQQITVDDAFPAWVLAGGMDDSGLAVCLPAQCTLQYETTSEGLLNVRLLYALPADAAEFGTGQSLDLPACILAPYRGTWLQGVHTLQQLLSAEKPLPELAGLRRELVEAARRHRSNEPEPVVVRVGTVRSGSARLGKTGWEPGRRGRAAAHPDSSWNAPRHCWTTCGTHIPRRLSLRRRPSGCHKLAATAEQPEHQPCRVAHAYQQVLGLSDRSALANPLLDFGPLLFCKRTADILQSPGSALLYGFHGQARRRTLPSEDRPGQSLACRGLFDGQLSRGHVPNRICPTTVVASRSRSSPLPAPKQRRTPNSSTTRWTRASTTSGPPTSTAATAAESHPAPTTI